MFTESADWYDRFQAGKDYAGEAVDVAEEGNTTLVRVRTNRRPGRVARPGDKIGP